MSARSRPQAELHAGSYPRVDLQFNAKKLILAVVLFCAGAELLFLVLDYHVNYGKATDIGALRRLTNIAREDSLASWFGTTQTFLIALTLWIIYFVARNETASKFKHRGWMLIAAFFTYMSLDDGSKFHERLGSTFKAAVQGDGADSGGLLLDFFPSYAWQVMFLPLFGSMALFIMYFMWRELRDRQALVIVFGAIACFVFAVGLDFVEGLTADHPLNLYTWIVNGTDLRDFTEYRFGTSPYDTLRHFSKAIEEATEMFGNTLLWSVFLRHLTGMAGELRFSFSRKAD